MNRLKQISAFLFFAVFATAGAKATEPADSVIIHNEPADNGRYVGSPSFVSINGVYYASHDFFGPNSAERKCGISRVYSSKDGGKTWEFCSEIKGAFWSRLIAIDGKLFMLAPDRNPSDAFENWPTFLKKPFSWIADDDTDGNRLMIRRSDDGGKTWTKPIDDKSGVIRAKGRYGCAPTPALNQNGKTYVCIGRDVMVIKDGANPLEAASWMWIRNTAIQNLKIGSEKTFCGECGVIPLEDGKIGVAGKVRHYECGDDRAGAFEIDENKSSMQFLKGSENGLLHMPGARVKFTMRYDGVSKKYWALTNYLPQEDYGERADLRRNTVALVSSADLINWKINCILLYTPDIEKQGWQYADFEIENNDITAVLRTAAKDESGMPPRAHDANRLTFHRIKNFRTLAIDDSCAAAKACLEDTIAKLKAGGGKAE